MIVIDWQDSLLGGLGKTRPKSLPLYNKGNPCRLLSSPDIACHTASGGNRTHNIRFTKAVLYR